LLFVTVNACPPRVPIGSTTSRVSGDRTIGTIVVNADRRVPRLVREHAGWGGGEKKEEMPHHKGTIRKRRIQSIRLMTREGNNTSGPKPSLVRDWSNATAK